MSTKNYSSKKSKCEQPSLVVQQNSRPIVDIQVDIQEVAVPVANMLRPFLQLPFVHEEAAHRM